MREQNTTPYVFCDENGGQRVHLKLCQNKCAKYYRCEYRSRVEADLVLADKPWDFFEEEPCQSVEDATKTLSS